MCVLNKDEISILDLVITVLNRWWVVAIFVVVFFIGSFTYTKTMITPVYTAMGSVYISVDNSNYLSNRGDYNDMLYARELVKNYVEILTSNTFFKSVSAECGLDYTFREIASLVSVSSLNESEVLVVNCIHPNPEHAAIIVETVLNNAQSEVARVVTGGNVKIVDHPEIPTAPSAPNTRKNVTVFSLLGFVLGVALVIIIELLDDRIKDSVSLREKFNYPVLAELPVFENSEQLSGKSYKVHNAYK